MSLPHPPLTTLLDVVRHRASADSGYADAPAFSYLDDGEHVSGALDYAGLDAAARTLAARLQRHTRPGDRVLLVYPPCLDYVVAFYACVYAGVIAVPTVSPSNARTLPRLRLMAADAAPTLALTRAELLARLPAMRGGEGGDDPLLRLRWIASDDGDDSATAEDWTPPPTQAADIVFLQYTSGSTGAPKGVMVSHANLLANAELSRQAYRIAERDVFVSWLPPHHDFGLIGAIVIPVWVGGHCVQFPPATFLMRPYRWLRLIDRYRARITGAPNFAYQLCVERVSEAEKAALDLSSLAVTVNGAERIRAGTLQCFAAAFAGCGLAPHSMTPSYGMAESVLMASANLATPAGATPRTRRLDAAALAEGRAEPAEGETGAEVVLTGAACTVDHRVAIVDPASGAELAAGRVGEIWLQGASVAQGYWGRPEESEQTFRAVLAGRDGRWLRTGDLGFLDADGLYVTGRSKEVMIFNGRNVYPQDVEIGIEALDAAFRSDGCAAFAVEDGEHAGLVIVQELERRRQPRLDGLVARIRAELAERHELADLAAVLLVRAGQVPRTSSGKIQRGRCRELFAAGALEPVWAWRRADRPADAGQAPRKPATPTERTLLAAWQAAFGRDDLSVHDDFFRLGGHSLLAVQLVGRLREAFGFELPLGTLFAAPTVAGLAQAIDAAQGGAMPALPPIVHGEHGARLPLCHAQQRFWFLDQYQPNNPFYAIPLALTLAGAVDAAALQRALDALVARHAPLRTVFQADGGQPQQVVLPNLTIPLRVVELGQLADPARAAEAEIAAEAQRGFDLAAGPLLRATLLRQAADRQVLLLTLHHIVYDGGSTGPLLDELAALYAAARDGRPAGLAPLAIDYADYVQWEAQHLRGDWLDQRLAWWREALAGAPTLLALPTDRPRQADPDQAGAAWPDRLPRALVERLAALGRDRGATLFMVLTAAMAALLHRLGGQDDFCLGILSANRPAGTERLIGNFVNVVPLRARLGGATAFPALLADTARGLLEHYERQLPFELILEHAAPQRDRSHTPYLQVVLNFHSELAQPPQWQDEQALRVAGRHPASVRHAAFDLKLEIHDGGGDGRSGDGLALSYEYATALFDAATIERLAGHFRTLLEAIAADPHATVGALPLLDAAERSRMLDGWNDNAAARPSCCIHELFEAQAARSPEAIAVACGARQLSYAALNARANQLAHHLRGLGVRPDSLVALCVERSLDLAVGILGILKAGAAYVPLDPDYPAQRLAWMLADTAAPVLLTQAALAERLPPHPRTLCLDRDWDEIARQSTDNPASLTTPQHLAYCIYTSGSTGTPKGAINTHAGFVNLALWYAGHDAERVLLASSPSFDLTQKNLLGTWLAGGTLIVPPGATADADAFRQALAEQRPTRINCAPSAFRAFVAGQPLPASLRSVMLGGEPIDAALAELLASNDVTLVNSYGPTECADVAICHAQLPSDGAVAPPLGKPLPNVRIYVLDAEQNPVPVGVAGEIHIAGLGVARGYLNRPGLTAERFVPDPFGAPGSRMYRTGDLGRYQADGTLLFLGRIDHQVKLRGLRIELGEIEGALLRCERVREAAVLLREDGGEPQLVGYVAGDATPAELRAHLLAELPAYMVPSAWVRLDALPLNPNGKTDRKALPAPDGCGVATAEYVAASTPTEIALAQIWAEVLQRPRVGIHDDFFALGGHSLLAMQVVARVRAQFAGVAASAPVRLFFEAPTIAQLAARLDAQAAKPAAPAIPKLARRNSVPVA
ncbi:non-ribosomal peptide synthetase [Chitinimonas koreensis]|uniref:non-ribosomal peptide synthetase n=2 Tax=Chitinimonas koreensis TaxID=356302 RepID=UPI001654141D|nr:non-ribosomal peptide synthetase [Chitinimonas koreensis]QNM96267.1 amino acid adenylation domain-containing protein [Chitinimonas koreensis]